MIAINPTEPLEAYVIRERIMTITNFLDGSKFDPEARRVMSVAFEMTCAALQPT